MSEYLRVLQEISQGKTPAPMKIPNKKPGKNGKQPAPSRPKKSMDEFLTRFRSGMVGK